MVSGTIQMTGLEHLAKVRKMPCLVCGHEASPHHLKTVGLGRNRKRELIEHKTVIPLCTIHHTEIHQIGIRRFNEKYNIDCWREAFRLVVGI